MYEYNSDFKMVQSRLLKEVDGFLHDFAVTENYYVFLSVSLWEIDRALLSSFLGDLSPGRTPSAGRQSSGTCPTAQRSVYSSKYPLLPGTMFPAAASVD